MPSFCVDNDAFWYDREPVMHPLHSASVYTAGLSTPCTQLVPMATCFRHASSYVIMRG